MFEYKFDFSEFSLVAQSLLTRIDFITDLLKSLPTDSNVYAIYENDLVATRALYDKLTLKC